MNEGVEKIKAVLAAAFSLHMTYDKAKADGKIDVADLGLIIDPVMKLPPAVQAVTDGSALKELKDLTSEEREALHTWAKGAYDIADDKLEATIESALGLGLHLAQFLGKALG